MTLNSLKQSLSNVQGSLPLYTAECAPLLCSLRGRWVGTSHIFNLFPSEYPPLKGFLCSRTCAAQQKHRITGSGWRIYSLLKWIYWIKVECNMFGDCRSSRKYYIWVPPLSSSVECELKAFVCDVVHSSAVSPH